MGRIDLLLSDVLIDVDGLDTELVEGSLGSDALRKALV